MDSFRRIARDMREERVARTRSTSPAGRGFMFCEKHRERFKVPGMCPTCSPRSHYRVR